MNITRKRADEVVSGDYVWTDNGWQRVWITKQTGYSSQWSFPGGGMIIKSHMAIVSVWDGK